MLICSECGKKVTQDKDTGVMIRTCNHQGPVIAQLKATVRGHSVSR